MKKKILALCLVVVLAVTAVTGVTLAYFTDTDQATNVMVSGGVSIIQNEQQRKADNDDEALEAFADGKALYPATGDDNKDGKIDSYKDEIYGDEFVDQNGNTQKIESDKWKNTPDENRMFALSNNAVDKIITVTNDGQSEAYIRTLIAFEIPTMKEAEAIYGEGDVPAYVKALDKEGKYVDIINMDHFLYTVAHEGAIAGKSYTLPKENDDYIVITDVNGVSYLVAEFYYMENDSKLAANETSHPSLCQVYLSAKATNEDAELVIGADDQYTIIAVSQAVQTTGFTSAAEAMKAAFGEVTAENCAEWILTNAPMIPVLP